MEKDILLSTLIGLGIGVIVGGGTLLRMATDVLIIPGTGLGSIIFTIIFCLVGVPFGFALATYYIAINIPKPQV